MLMNSERADQITSNFLVYNLLLPHGRHGHVSHGGPDGIGRDGTKLTFKLDFLGNL